MKLDVYQCEACGTTVFPQRYYCPTCGAGAWRALSASPGTVAETTIVRHRAGAAEQGDLHLATIVTAAGPRLIATSLQALVPGASVALSIDDAGRIIASA